MAYISRDITLFPGDIISTGTPPGVGIFRDPPIVLQPGNVVECRIDGIGAIRWVTVEAAGYLEGFVEGFGDDDLRVYEIRLAWIGGRITLESGDTGNLFLGDVENPTHEATLDASSFAVVPVTVGIGKIKPIHVLPLFEPLSSDQDLNLQMAFGLDVRDADFDAVALNSGSTISVRIRDEGVLSAGAVLAYFDPDKSEWQVMQGGLSRDGGSHVLCSIDVISPLFGIFDDQEASYLTSALYRTAFTDNDMGDAYNAAMQTINGYWAFINASGCLNFDPPCDPRENEDYVKAVAVLVKAAKDYATANQNEKGKMALLSTVSKMNLLGFTEYTAELDLMIEVITNKIGQDYVDRSDCGVIREMLHILKQFYKLGGDSTIEAKNREKIDEYMTKCDLWTGSIFYHYYLDEGDPCLGNLILKSGGGEWSEVHHVRMATHGKTKVLTGEISLHLNFPEAYFKTSDECEHSKSYSGNPAAADLSLKFDGTYDGMTFAVKTPGPADTPIDITVEHVMKFKNEEDECELIEGYPTVDTFPNYTSALVHGFLISPPISLQHMLEDGHRYQNSLIESIKGDAKLENLCEETNMGRYPFSSGWVHWSFHHVQKLLPLEE